MPADRASEVGMRFVAGALLGVGHRVRRWSLAQLCDDGIDPAEYASCVRRTGFGFPVFRMSA